MGGDRSNTRWLDDVSAEVIQRAARVQLAIFDVDGVLSDGKIYFSDEGRELKAFHARDGYGLKMLLKHGIQVAIITGRSSPIVAHRMTALGIDHVYQGREDKRAAYEHLIAALEIDAKLSGEGAMNEALDGK